MGAGQTSSAPLVPEHDRASRWRGTQGYAASLIAGLLAATSVVVAATRPWVTATAVQPNLPRLEVAVDGTTLSPLAGAMGLVILAAFGAVVATRGRVRRILGVVIVASAGLVLVVAISPGDESQAVRTALAARGWIGGHYETAGSPWRLLVVVGAIVCMAAGVSTACFGHRWATMGKRYDAPQPESHHDGGELTDTDLWRALDHGHDPTQRS